jgi:hypothetical protein
MVARWGGAYRGPRVGQGAVHLVLVCGMIYPTCEVLDDEVRVLEVYVDGLIGRGCVAFEGGGIEHQGGDTEGHDKSGCGPFEATHYSILPNQSIL